jgi:hypothetical protein
MAERKAFLLRIDREVFVAVRRWAGDDLRSLNAQIEFLLRRALRAEGRLKPSGGRGPSSNRLPQGRGTP